MKILYIIRHAKATSDPAYHWDFERPLDSRGEEEAPVMANRLAHAISNDGLEPEIIVSSPAVRTLATARFFASAFDLLETDVVQIKDLYDASLHDLLKTIHGLPPEKNIAILVGHNPSVTLTASLFSESHIEHVPTCGVLKIAGSIESWKDFKPGKATLIEFYSPKSHNHI